MIVCKISNIVGHKELVTERFWKAVLAEVIASFVYIVIACGSGFHVPTYDHPSNLHIALTVGIIVAVLASAFWDISGGHFNPAVTIGLTVAGKVPLIRCLFYVVAQCAGSAAGAGLLYGTIPKDLRGHIGALFILESVHPGFVFLIEVIITFQFIMTVFASTDPKRGFVGFQAPLAIGLSVSVGLMMALPITGGCMNPIRAFGPAVVAQRLDHHWLYWMGPFTGSILAALMYKYVFSLSWADCKSSLSDAPATQNIRSQQTNV